MIITWIKSFFYKVGKNKTVQLKHTLLILNYNRKRKDKVDNNPLKMQGNYKFRII